MARKTFLALLLLLFSGPPAVAQWTPQPAELVGNLSYDQNFTFAFTTTGAKTGQDMTWCGAPTVTLSGSDTRIAFYDCESSTFSDATCQHLRTLPEDGGFGPITLTLDNAYLGVNVIDAGAGGGSVTAACTHLDDHVYDSGSWVGPSGTLELTNQGVYFGSERAARATARSNAGQVFFRETADLADADNHWGSDESRIQLWLGGKKSDDAQIDKAWFIGPHVTRRIEEYGPVTMGHTPSTSQRAANTTTLQAAIDGICDANNNRRLEGFHSGTILVPNGVLKINPDGVDIDCELELAGAGRASNTGSAIWLDGDTATWGLKISSDKVAIRDLLIFCDDADDSYSNANFKCVNGETAAADISELVMRRVSVSGSGSADNGFGIYLDGPSTITFDDVRVNGLKHPIVFGGNGASGGNVLVNPTLTATSGGSGIYIDGTQDALRQLAVLGGRLQGGLHGIWQEGTGLAGLIQTVGTYFEQTGSCTDLYDTGGPPQTSGSPDKLCDSDANTPTTVAVEVEDPGLTAEVHGYLGQSGHDSFRRRVAIDAGRMDVISGYINGDIDSANGTCFARQTGGGGDITDCAVRWDGPNLFAAEGTFSSVLNPPSGTTPPASCEPPAIFVDTDAPSGDRLLLCESTNTWVAQ